jgi:hypothetical protein
VARHAAKSIHCGGEALMLGPCADGQFLKKQGNRLVGADVAGDGGGGVWGEITGTLSSQTDLQGALDGKENAGAAASAVSTHEAQGDPHPGYLTPAEGDAAYAALVHSHNGLAPTGGTTGQVLKKSSNTNYDYAWAADATSEGGGVTLAEVIDTLYPVGSLYTSTLSTNPGTLLGRGTWTAFGAGRVMVGHNAADTDFDTAEETGGSKTSSAVVNHTHPVVVDDPQHAHVENSNNATTGGLRGWGAADTSTSSSAATGYSTAPASTGITATTSNPAGGVASFSLMNPYIVVYAWKRTA